MEVCVRVEGGGIKGRNTHQQRAGWANNFASQPQWGEPGDEATNH